MEEEEPIDYDEGIGSMSMMDGMEDDDDDVALVEVRGCSGLFCVASPAGGDVCVFHQCPLRRVLGSRTSPAAVSLSLRTPPPTPPAEPHF